jgi:sensor domain CHASE-containing protein
MNDNKKLIYNGIVISIETSGYTYEQVQEALKNFRDYADTLTNLRYQIPEHIEIAIYLLKCVEPEKRYKNYTKG